MSEYTPPPEIRELSLHITKLFMAGVDQERLRRKLSVRQLGELVGFNSYFGNRYSEWLYGREMISLTSLARLLLTLELSVDLHLSPPAERSTRFHANLIARTIEPILEDIRNGR